VAILQDQDGLLVTLQMDDPLQYIMHTDTCISQV
jgi:hypothetical protein